MKLTEKGAKPKRNLYEEGHRQNRIHKEKEWGQNGTDRERGGVKKKLIGKGTGPK